MDDSSPPDRSLPSRDKRAPSDPPKWNRNGEINIISVVIGIVIVLGGYGLWTEGHYSQVFLVVIFPILLLIVIKKILRLTYTAGGVALFVLLTTFVLMLGLSGTNLVLGRPSPATTKQAGNPLDSQPANR